MKKKNIYWIAAGILNFLTFLLHLIGGQLDLVDPMIDIMITDKSSQLVGAWHMVTIVLLLTSYILLSAGYNKKYSNNPELIKMVAYLNLIFCLPFMISSLYYGLLVPQWIFFLPIAILTFIGIRKTT